MAKLKATPKNFAEALEWLWRNAPGRSSARLGNNTYLEFFSGGGIVVRFHNTRIVWFREDEAQSVQLFTGGYRTVTTKERINQFILGYVFQKKGKWFVASGQADGHINFNAPREFVEGFTLYAFETK